MKRLVALSLAGVVLVCAPGCGGPDALMKEFLANLNLYAETLEKKESPERQRAAEERVYATVEKINKLGPAEQERLVAKYDEDLKKVTARIQKAQKEQLLEGGAVPPNPADALHK
jgi:hypothetical protein